SSPRPRSWRQFGAVRLERPNNDRFALNSFAYGDALCRDMGILCSIAIERLRCGQGIDRPATESPGESGNDGVAGWRLLSISLRSEMPCQGPLQVLDSLAGHGGDGVELKFPAL